MTTLLNAARNNAEWFQLVAEACGSPGRFSGEYWSSAYPLPEYCANLSTYLPANMQVLEHIEALVSHSPEQTWRVKDCFNQFDLSPLGFQLVLEEFWVYLPPDAILPELEGDARFYEVKTAAQLLEWSSAWAGGVPITQLQSASEYVNLFPATLPASKDLTIMAGVERDKITFGAMLLKSSNVLGIYLMFLSSSHQIVKGLAFIRNQFPQLPIIGTASGDATNYYLSLGFENLGPLKNWEKS